jgi:hypothetical protein
MIGFTQIELSQIDNDMKEYNFERVKNEFKSLVVETFDLEPHSIPTSQELLDATSVSDTSRIVLTEAEDGGVYFELPEKMNPNTALTFLCFLSLSMGDSHKLIKMYTSFSKQLRIRRDILNIKLYALAKIQSDMFEDESLEEYKLMIEFAKGMASYLFFEKLSANAGKIRTLKDYPTYNFFSNIVNPEKPELGFGIPMVVKTPEGEEINVDELPVLGFQDSDNINDYYDFEEYRINKDGEKEYKPTEKLIVSNEHMKMSLNKGQGLDAFFKVKGYNVITIHTHISEIEMKGVITGELIYNNGVIKEGTRLDVEDKNILLLLGPIKRSPRSIEKVNKSYKGDASFLSDLVRATFVCKNSNQLKKFNDLFYEGMPENGCMLATRPKDRFTNPLLSGYGDILTIWLLPNNFACEVQISLIEMAMVKEEAHHYYEIERKYFGMDPRSLTMEQKKERSDAQRKQQEIYREARFKSGLRDLKEVLNEMMEKKKMKKNGSLEVRYFDYNSMPAFSRSGVFYYINFYNKINKVTIDEKFKFEHEAMEISRLQFDGLVKEFKEVLRIKS